ncbi:nuclear transport factor 2 family protein [Nocardioides sp. SYSU DS0663]|uniref:nuclear transport factor 2 family protein n=1 Tax=Nocardioides sp. SYSU DS0663 TaxID=3416445 RepID=UPI003F4B596E
MTSTSDDLLRSLELQRAGEVVLHRYQRLVDQKDLDGLAASVSDDVVIQRQGGEAWHGRGRFRDFYRRFTESDVVVAHHMVTNLQVTDLRPDGAPDSIRIDSCFLAITTHESGEARMMWGRYCDDAVRSDDSWLMSAKRIALVRTAFIEESALAPADMVSFAPRTR